MHHSAPPFSQQTAAEFDIPTIDDQRPTVDRDCMRPRKRNFDLLLGIGLSSTLEDFRFQKIKENVITLSQRNLRLTEQCYTELCRDAFDE